MQRLFPLILCCWFINGLTMDLVVDQSVFAVVTHKDGIASGLAHDHFIHANNLKAAISGASTEDLAVDLVFDVAGLEVDEVTQIAKWSAQLKELGIQKEEFTRHSDKTSKKIHKAMWDKKQLNKEAFPQIKAQIKKVEQAQIVMGKRTFAYRITVAITIVGKTVDKEFGANITYNEGVLNLEAATEARFTDFGIKPYSAMFGAVANQDLFYFYVNLTAR